MGPAEFEVRVAGVVPAEDLLDLGVVALRTELPQTVLYGNVRDEATLFGLLARLRSLGLEVVEVRQVPELAPLDEPEELTVDAGQEANPDQEESR